MLFDLTLTQNTDKFEEKNRGLRVEFDDIFDQGKTGRKPNMYGSENRRCVFASSDDASKALYAARVTAGGMTVDRKKCLFKNDPFSGYHEGVYILKKRAYAYILDPEDFMPVIDFTVDKAGKCHIHFEGEWMSEKESVRPKACFEVDSVKERSFDGIELLYESADGSIVPVLSDEN